MFNKVLNPSDSEKLSNHLLNLIEGEVYFPDDNEILNLITSDPLTDPIGVWRLLMISELNGIKLVNINQVELQNLFSLMLLFKIISLCKFDIFLGSCLNPLS
jgi:hypothetical protein